MAVKNIETRAIISAQDQTGATFSAVSEKLRAMEGVARKAGETTAAIGGKFGAIAPKVDGVTKSISLMGAAVAGAAALGIEKLGELAKSVIDVGVEMDRLKRRQSMLLKLTPEQTKAFDEQSERLARTTPFGEPETTKARTELAGRGLTAGEILPLIENASKYALVEGIELPEAAKLLETAQFAEGGKKLSPKELSHRMDEMVKASQLGGMNPADLDPIIRGGIAEAGGISHEKLLAGGAIMARAHIPDPGATMARIVASINKPTPEALSTLAAMGIDRNKFVKPAAGLRAENLSAVSKEMGFAGGALTTEGIRRVQAILSNPKIAGDEAKLSEALTKVLTTGFSGTPSQVKSMSAGAKKVVAKFLEDSIGDVDAGGLLDAIAAKHPSASQAEAIFTKRGGGAFKALSDKAGEWANYERQIQGVPEGFTGQEAGGLMGGLYGAQLHAANEKKLAEEKIAEDNKDRFKAIYDTETQLAKAFNDATPEVRLMAEAAAGAAVALAAFGGIKMIEKRGFAGAAAGLLGGTLAGAAAVPLAAAGIGAASILGSTPTGDFGGFKSERERQSAFGQGWLANQPPPAGKFTPTPGGLGHFAELRGAADVSVKVDVGFSTPDLIANRIDKALSARGNMAVDTGISMRK